jgi:hypothetical protein
LDALNHHFQTDNFYFNDNNELYLQTELIADQLTITQATDRHLSEEAGG